MILAAYACRVRAMNKDTMEDLEPARLRGGDEAKTAALETRVMQAEQALRQLLLANDVDALRAWLSPALFFSDAAGQWLGTHPCLATWSARQQRLTQLEQTAVEYLPCGQLALVSSDVRLVCVGGEDEQVHALRLLRVWASCSSPAGVHLLSVGVLPARGH